VANSVGAVKRTRARVRLIFFLARRSLASSRVTLVLLVLAIAAGAGFQIPNSANLDAFEQVLLDEGLTRGAGDIRVEPRDRATFQDGDAIAARWKAIPGVRETLPLLIYPGAVGVKGRFLGVPIYGIDPVDAPPFHMVSGASLAYGDKDGILVGNAIAKRLALTPGSQVELRVIFGPAGAAIDDDNLGRYTAIVRGVVAGSAGAYRAAFVDRSFLAAEAGAPKAASVVIVRLDDHEAAGDIAALIASASPEVDAVAWRDDDPYLPNYLKANHTIHRVSYAMVIAAVSVPMWALLYINVLKRRREIAILAALGFGRAEVFWVFLLQALLVAILGCAIGSLLGYGAICWFAAHPLFEWETFVIRPAAAIATFAVPAIVVTITALVAGSYPAWRAARTESAQVLRRLE
jgi:ABC-type lipoprotein release transport system permease subunit